MESVQPTNLTPTEGVAVTLLIPYGGARIEKPYITKGYIVEHLKRYDKWVVIPPGFASDGATGAIDIKGSVAWFVHDWLCDYGTWHDGTPVNNWQASRVITDLLRRDGYGFRRFSWFWPTWLFGGGECRKNGMW